MLNSYDEDQRERVSTAKKTVVAPHKEEVSKKPDIDFNVSDEEVVVIPEPAHKK